MSVRWAWLVVGLGVCAAVFVIPGSLWAEAEKPLSPAQKEVLAVMDAYNKAVAAKDLDACMAAFVPGPDAFVMGTGPGESWRGPEEIRRAHVNFFKSFDKETTEPIWRNVMVSGDIAWAAAHSRMVDEYKGKKNEFFLNISAVFQKKDGAWRCALLHFSNLTGPDRTKK